MLTIDSPIVLAQSQTFALEEIHISKKDDNFVAYIAFAILDEEGKKVDRKIINYDELAFNDFWKDFNSVHFLYNELKVKDTVEGAIDEPTECEEELVNVISSDEEGGNIPID